MLIRGNTNNILLLIFVLATIKLSTATESNIGCFVCEDKTGCVSPAHECDGKYDCSDHSDEKDCENKKPDECLPPVIESGRYVVLGNNYYRNRKPIPSLSIIEIKCDNENYKLVPNYSTVHCINGKFSQEIPKCVFRNTCLVSFPYFVDVKCVLHGKEERCITNSSVRAGTYARMKCKPNFIDKTPEYAETFCSADGVWSNPIKECLSSYKCPPRPSTAINVYCELNGVVQDCSKEVPDGTYSRMTCKANYIDVNDGPTEATCLNGTWTEPMKTCTPDCNHIVIEGQANIVKGSSANRGQFPWHVAVYRQQQQKQLDYICGGSIISVKVVLTAAHCLTNPNNGEIYPASEFSVAAGKQYSKWESSEDEYYVQKRNVSKIYTPQTIYFGQLSNYAGDIAVVVVDRLFSFTNFISNVCVDWNLEYTNQQLINGTLGKVAGWGVSTTENPAPSPDLQHVLLPFVEREMCQQIVPINFIAYITVDKFCAGLRNGSSVCSGDSGGGIVFTRHENRINKYYVQGILSVGPTKDGVCDTHQLGVYTRVSSYISFVKELETSNRI